MAAGAGELEQLLDGGRRGRELGLGRPSPPHRNNDDIEIGGEHTGGVTGDRGLADALARSDNRDRRQLEGRKGRRVEPEVGAHVREPGGEHAAREPEAVARSEHGLVREVVHQLRLELRDRILQVVRERNAVVVAASQLLGPADEYRCRNLVWQRRERVADDGRVVLAVDEGQSPHAPGRLSLAPGEAGLRERLAPLERERGHRVVTSRSIPAVYFWNASVSSENSMIRSRPWNG